MMDGGAGCPLYGGRGSRHPCRRGLQFPLKGTHSSSDGHCHLLSSANTMEGSFLAPARILSSATLLLCGVNILMALVTPLSAVQGYQYPLLTLDDALLASEQNSLVEDSPLASLAELLSEGNIPVAAALLALNNNRLSRFSSDGSSFSLLKKRTSPGTINHGKVVSIILTISKFGCAPKKPFRIKMSKNDSMR
ncbi:uncharacterized protein LOC135223633 [Macrobrachium nipponense]|uniref:uncharacterized protein LOC135223633 n=1 Tax=Macrobrachium nipponense TaxID=159736 RepID=UPI0030C8B146